MKTFELAERYLERHQVSFGPADGIRRQYIMSAYLFGHTAGLQAGENIVCDLSVENPVNRAQVGVQILAGTEQSNIERRVELTAAWFAGYSEAMSYGAKNGRELVEVTPGSRLPAPPAYTYH